MYEPNEEVTESDIYDVLPSLKRTKYKNKVEIEEGVLVLQGESKRTNNAAKEAVGNIIIKDANGGVEEEIVIKATPRSTEEYVEKQKVEIKVTSTQSLQVTNGKYAWSTSKEEEPTNYKDFTLNREDSKNGNGTIPEKSVEEKGEYYLWVKVRGKVECFGPYKLEEMPTRDNLVCTLTPNETGTEGKVEVGSKKVYSGWKCYYIKNGGEETEITNGQTIEVNVVKNDVIVVKYKKEGYTDIEKRVDASELKITYTLIYDANGGVGTPARQTQYDNKTFTITSDKPTKDGYDFVNWKDEEGNMYNGGDSITILTGTSITLTVQWEESLSITAKTTDTSNITRKTNTKLASLFDISYGSSETGTAEYEVTRNLLFNNTSYHSTTCNNLSELELGTYKVKCTIYNASKTKSKSATKENIVIGSLATTTVTDKDDKNTQSAKAIYSEYDLAYFRDNANEGTANINGKLMNDITLANTSSSSVGGWAPIGYYDGVGIFTGIEYSGTFDGNNKIVTIVKLSSDTKYQSSGLFGMVIDGTVKNIAVNSQNTLVSNAAVSAPAVASIKKWIHI